MKHFKSQSKMTLLFARNFSISFFLIAILFISSLGFSFVDAAFNKQINYQGKLTNLSGVAVADGLYNMEFKLMTVSSGGDTTQGSCTTSCAWIETRISGDKVQVTNGLFSVMLGEVTTLAGVDFNQTLYLAINIGGTGSPSWDGLMTPRKKLGAVPAAVESERVGGFTPAQSATGSQIPVLTSDTLILGGTTAGLKTTSTNALTFQSGVTGDIQFFSSSNKITSAGVLTLASSALVGAGSGVDTSAAGALTFGNTTATSISLCNSAACDTLSIGTNADADAINIGDSLDTITITGASASSFVLNAVTVTATEFNVLDAGIEAGDLVTQGATTDEFCLTYEGTSGALLEWQSCGGGVPDADYGDITVASGVWNVDPNSVALTTDTTGNYVQSVTTDVLTGLTGGNTAGEGTNSALAFDYSQALSGDVGLGANASVFGQSGLVFEGSTANTIETYFVITNPTSSDKTITFPDATGTVALTSDLSSYLPLAGGTMVGNILATDNTYDIGASGANRFRTAYFGTSLDVPTANVTTKVLNANGNAGAPSYSFTSDSDNGMFLVGSNSLGLAAGGTENIRLSATDNWFKRNLMYLGSGADLALVYEGAAILQLGSDGATPIAQLFKAMDGTGSNIAGSNLLIAGGRSTGSSAGGSLIFQTSPAGGAGVGVNALVTALTITSTGAATFAGTVTLPTPFTLGATSVTSTGTQLNYLNAATGTTGTTSTNLVFSTSPTLVTPVLGAATYTTLSGGAITNSALRRTTL
jgi:hypothetical protein